MAGATTSIIISRCDFLSVYVNLIMEYYYINTSCVHVFCISGMIFGGQSGSFLHKEKVGNTYKAENACAKRLRFYYFYYYYFLIISPLVYLVYLQKVKNDDLTVDIILLSISNIGNENVSSYIILFIHRVRCKVL